MAYRGQFSTEIGEKQIYSRTRNLDLERNEKWDEDDDTDDGGRVQFRVVVRDFQLVCCAPTVLLRKLYSTTSTDGSCIANDSQNAGCRCRLHVTSRRLSTASTNII